MERHQLRTWGELFEHDLEHRAAEHELDAERGEELLEPFQTVEQAAFFLHEYACDERGMRVMREALEETWVFLGTSRMGDREVVTRLAECLAWPGILRVIRRPSLPPLLGFLPPPDEKKEAPEAETQAWIKLRVVDDESDQAISGVKLELYRSDGTKATLTTGPGGKAELTSTTPGRHEVTCDLVGVELKEMLVFVAVGDIGPGTTKKPGTSKERDEVNGTRIAKVQQHRVKTGETLESIAKAAGMTWQALARFNFGTTEEKEAYHRLCHEVGCARLDSDGRTPLFDDTDEPGYLYIPKEWRQALETNKAHVLRVRRALPREALGCVWVSLRSPFEHPIGRVTCQLTGGGRKKWPLRATDDEGQIYYEGLPLSEDYSIKMNLAGRSLEVPVPWMRERFLPLNLRLLGASELLGLEDDPHGIQVRLLGLGHDPGPIDGVVGRRTRSALDSFTEKRGLQKRKKIEPGILEALADLFGA